jgi:mannose-binding lectin 2
VWSRKALAVDNFSSLLKFRISGQGKNFFGDGLAIWIVQQGYYVDGNLHGFIDRFTGVGIIFDTFKNTENLAQHRDVTILINDGTKTLDQMYSDNHVIGCDANVRYHAERADFKVTDQSRAKIVVEDTKLTVLVDARNTGQWTECVKVDLPLPSGWAKRSHIGITASTGQLADNHDVLGLITHSDEAGLAMEEEFSASKKKFALDQDVSTEENVKHIANTINEIMSSIDLLHHHLEHELAEVDDHIKTMITKLEAKGEKSEGRLDNLEEMVSATVQGTIEDRLRKLENQLKGQINQKVTRVERQIEKDMNKLEKLGSSAGSWKVPFILMLLVMIAAGIGMFMFYRKMMKIHLL